MSRGAGGALAKVGPVKGSRAKGELTQLPPARRPLKVVTTALMAVTALLSLWLAYSLRSEAAFALARAEAVDLGRLDGADLSSHEGAFVRASVALEGQPTATFSRPLDPVRYRMTRTAGGVWVVYPVPASLEGPRFVPPTLVAGRLERFEELGVRFRGVAERLPALDPTLSREAWVLVDGEDPTNMGWVLGLEVLLFAFAAFNLVSLVRIVRPVG